MDSQTLLILLLVLVAVAVVLLAVLVLRRPETRIGDLLERALRDEQREGRGELREQLDESNIGPRVDLHTADELPDVWIQGILATGVRLDSAVTSDC